MNEEGSDAKHPPRSHVSLTFGSQHGTSHNAIVVASVSDTQDQLKPTQSKFHKAQRVLGTVFLIGCICAYLIQAVILQKLQHTYKKPYFLLWFSHSCFTFIVPVSLCVLAFNWRRFQGNVKRRSIAADSNESIQLTPSSSDAADADDYEDLTQNDDDDVPLVIKQSMRCGSLSRLWLVYEKRLLNDFNGTWKSFLFRAATLSILYTVPNYLWYVALSFTSIGEITTIFNTNCFFAYAFSIWLLGDSVKWQKIIAIIISIGGVMLITFEDQISNKPVGSTESTADNSTIFGDGITMFAAFLYGLYEVLYTKYAVPHATPHSSPSLFLAIQFTGFIGLFTLTLQWIPIPILSAVGIEIFSLPPTPFATLMLLLNALMSVLYNTLFMLAIALTSPLFASVGIMMTVPLSIIVEYASTGNVSIGFVGACGTLGILVGFFLLAYDQFKTPNQELVNTVEIEE